MQARTFYFPAEPYIIHVNSYTDDDTHTDIQLDWLPIASLLKCQLILFSVARHGFYHDQQPVLPVTCTVGLFI